MTVTIGVPYYGCPDLIEKCVRSILAQTHRDLICVVIGDGEDPPLKGIRDDRLVVYRLLENRGAYFGEQLIIEATPHDWYGVVGADDWVDPDHVASLAAFDSNVAPGAVWYHNNGLTKIVRKVYEVGLFRTANLRTIGGYNPAERLGQDSLTIHLLRTTYGYAVNNQPTYHRVQRPGSLTTDPRTKRGSAFRNEMRARNRALLAECERLKTPERIGAYRRSLVPQEIADELATHVERLKGLLSA